MKVAIVHDHFLYIGGAERVAFSLLRMFSDADLYTLFIKPEIRRFLRRSMHGNIYTSPYANLIHSEKFADWIKPFIYHYWETLDFTGYDLVISSSHSFSSKSIVAGPATVHVAYIYTPPRYLWDEFNEHQWTRQPFFAALMSPALWWLRKKDIEGAKRPSVLIADSKNVQRRIKKYYQRDSVVVYPPVHISRRPLPRMPMYYLCVSRLVRQKGIEYAIRACNRLHAPLVVVGIGKEDHALRSIAGPTITFLGWISDAEMGKIYQGARALIFPAIEEDFGLVPVEAMAHGVPVIAYRSGGVTESVIHKKTGWLFSDLSAEGLARAIQDSEKYVFSERACKDRVKRFSETIFRHHMKTVIQKALRSHG